jgi:hypothetical protein
MNIIKTLVQEALTPEQIQEKIEARRLKSRTDRTKKRAKRREKALSASKNKVAVGASAYPATSAGFKTKKLPTHFNVIINELRKQVYSGKFDDRSTGLCRQMSNTSRKKLFEILVTIVTRTDFISGQIGIPKKNGFHTISHDDLMLQHAARWGYSISSSTWYRYIDLIKKHDVFRVVEAKSHVSRGKVKSYAAYKWLKLSFLKTIGVFSDDIKAGIEKAYQKTLASGKSFKWLLVHTKQVRKHHEPACFDLEFDFDAPPPIGAYSH